MPSLGPKQEFERQVENLIIQLEHEEDTLPLLSLFRQRGRYTPYSTTPGHRLRATLFQQSQDKTLIEELMEAYEMSKQHRYLYRGKTGARRIRTAEGPGLTEGDRRFEAEFEQKDYLWKHEARVSFESFLHIRDLIRNDPVFANNSHIPQEPLSYQLYLALCRLGGYGNRASFMKTAKDKGICVGSVDNFTRRVTAALCRLTNHFIIWPEEDRRSRIKKEIGRDSIFHDCIGYVDGSLIPLADKPSMAGSDDFFSRKGRYGFNALLVCDTDRAFIYAKLGAVGSVHDQTVLDQSDLASGPERYFERGEYLLADSGYRVDPNIVPAFKNSRNGIMTSDEKRFNVDLTHVRVTIEHAIGIFKERWQSLKELRHRIRNSRDYRRTLLWIRACMVLHNILIGRKDEEFLEGEDLELLRSTWHRDALDGNQERLRKIDRVLRSSSRIRRRPGEGDPAYRAYLLTEARDNGWAHAYAEGEEE